MQDDIEQMGMGRYALVTGASRGIGRAIALALAADGYNLLLTGRDQNTLIRVSNEIATQYHRMGVCKVCDMGDPQAVAELLRRPNGVVDRLELVVNNAGISEVGLLQDMSIEDWDHILRVNLSSCFYTAKYVIPVFLERAGRIAAAGAQAGGSNAVPGRIINISSVWGNVGASCEVAYSATKGGMNAFTRALAKELAPSGIPVNAIACGCVDTTMNDHLSPEDKEALAEEIPAGRFASPEEIAEIVMHLVHSPAYLTGQVITVDGGWQ